MTKKAHPELVSPTFAELAMRTATQRTHIWTQYILAHYRATGNLAPGCDYRDLNAWLEQNMPTELAAVTRKV